MSLLLLLAACDPSEPPALDVTSPAMGCWSLQADDGWLARDGEGWAWTAEDAAGATPFRLQPATGRASATRAAARGSPTR